MKAAEHSVILLLVCNTVEFAVASILVICLVGHSTTTQHALSFVSMAAHVIALLAELITPPYRGYCFMSDIRIALTARLMQRSIGMSTLCDACNTLVQT